MFLYDLPHSVLYHLCKYLSFVDIINLSKTCTRLFTLIERNNYFWMVLIQKIILDLNYINVMSMKYLKTKQIRIMFCTIQTKIEKNLKTNIETYQNIWCAVYGCRMY